MNARNSQQKTYEVTEDQLKKVLNISNCKIAEEVANILGMSPKEFEKFKKEKKFYDLISQKTSYHLLDPDYFSSKDPDNINFLKTLISVGANQEDCILGNNGKDKSYKNFAKNYKSWIGEKLHLTKDEISKISIDDLDLKASKYLGQAIEHINRIFSFIPKEYQDLFKSKYFESIHELGADQKTILDLIMYYFRLEKDKKEILKAGRSNADAIKNHTIAQFEIQRLLVLASLFRDREQNHEYQHLKEDESFIKAKLIEIFADKGKPAGTTWVKGLKSNSGLYDYTTTETCYINQKTDGTYEINNSPKDSKSTKISLDSTTIEGYTDFYKEKKSKVKVRHIGLRTAKDASSVIDKFVMKGFSSFTEILDQKGIIIVLDDYKDADKLEQILANELGTKLTSWVEKMEFVGKHNENSSNNYRVKKGIIKISYKAKDRKQKMKDINNDIAKLEELIKKDSHNPEKIELVKKLKKDIEYLKNRLKNLSYNLEVEVQIFDMQNYIKAEIDRSCPAHHENYKKYQRTFDLIPKIFPTSIYGEENLKKVIMPVIDERFKKEGNI